MRAIVCVCVKHVFLSLSLSHPWIIRGERPFSRSHSMHFFDVSSCRLFYGRRMIIKWIQEFPGHAGDKRNAFGLTPTTLRRGRPAARVCRVSSSCRFSAVICLWRDRCCGVCWLFFRVPSPPSSLPPLPPPFVCRLSVGVREPRDWTRGKTCRYNAPRPQTAVTTFSITEYVCGRKKPVFQKAERTSKTHLPGKNRYFRR